MAITLDTRNTGAKSAGATSLSWTHTLTAAGSSIVIALGTTGDFPIQRMSSANWDDGGTPVAMSKTVNGVSAAQDEGSGAAVGDASFWYLLSPSVTGARTIKLTPTASCELTGGSISFTGVHQSSSFNAASPQKTARGANINPTTDVTGASGEWVVDVVQVNESGAASGTVGAGQTEIANNNNGSATSLGLCSDEVGAATVTMSWTGLTSNNAGTGQVCVSLVPVPAAMPGSFRMPIQIRMG